MQMKFGVSSYEVGDGQAWFDNLVLLGVEAAAEPEPEPEPELGTGSWVHVRDLDVPGSSMEARCGAAVTFGGPELLLVGCPGSGDGAVSRATPPPPSPCRRPASGLPRFALREQPCPNRRRRWPQSVGCRTTRRRL